MHGETNLSQYAFVWSSRGFYISIGVGSCAKMTGKCHLYIQTTIIRNGYRNGLSYSLFHNYDTTFTHLRPDSIVRRPC